MAEDIDGALGIRVTIEADDIKTSAQQWVDTITNMQTKTNEVVQGMNETLSSLSRQVEDFGKVANGMSLSEIGEKLNIAKANFIETTQTIQQQKIVIADINSVLQDYGYALREAKESGNSKSIEEITQKINETKDALILAKNEQKEFIEQQREASEQIKELSKAYEEAKKSQPSFDGVVNGATSAAERVQALKQSFADFQNTLKSANDTINGLSEESSKSTSVGDNGLNNVAKIVTTRYIAEGAEEVQEKSANVAKGLKEVGAAYAAASATAQTAFNEQKNVVQTLEGQISNLQIIMQQAVKSGDISSATEVAAQIQTLESQLTSAKNRLSELQQQAANANKDLSQFGEISTSLSQRVEQQSTVWGRLKDKIQSVGSTIGDFASNQIGKGKTAITSFTGVIDGMGIPMSKTITNFGKMTKAAMAFIATPLGMILGAIALALKSVHTWLNKSAEGQKVMAQVSAFFGSIMNSITDIVIAFGKYLYKTFTGGNQAVSDFISTFVTSFKTGFSAVKNLVVGFGTIFKGVWQIITGEISEGWDTLKDGVSQMGTGLIDAGKNVVNQIKTAVAGIKAGISVVSGLFTDEELKNSLSNSFSGMIPNAKKAAQYALMNLTLSKKEGEAKERSLKLDKEIADLREKAYMLTGKEKDEALKKAKQLTKEKFYGKDIVDQKTGQKKHEDGILDVQKKQYDNLVKQNKLHTQTLQTIKAERQARIGLLQTEATAAASTRMITRMEQANLRSMASKAQSTEKKGLNQSNAVTSANVKVVDIYNKNNLLREQDIIKIENAIADARIAAMKDGYARTREEREKQNKDELDKIKQQGNAAVEAEIKRQKAEYEAEQDVIKARGGRITAWNDSMIDNSAVNKIKDQYKSLYDFTEKKQQRKTVDSLAQTYDKQEQERQDRINSIRNDIAELEEQLSKATSQVEKEELEKLHRNAQAQLDWVSQSKDAWNEYYEKYGTFLEKRAALEAKFLHDTQGMDVNSAHYKIQQKQFEKSVKDLEFEEIKKQLNWEDVFGDLSRLGKSVLADLQQQLETLLQNDKNLSVESIKTINDAINKVRDEQAKKGPLIGGMFSSLKELSGKNKAAKETQSQVERVAGGSTWNRYKNASTTEEKAQIRAENVFDPVTHKLVTFGEMLDRASKAAKEQSDAQKKASQSIKSVGSGFSAISSAGKDVSTMLEKFGINVPEGLTQTFNGLGEIGSAFEGFDLTKIGSFLDINNYIHAAVGVVTGVFDVFEGIVSIFGRDKGVREWQKELEHYQKLSSIWSDLINKKKEYINIKYGDDAKKEIKEILELYAAEEKSIKKVGSLYLKKHSFNAHSEGYRINKSINNAGGWDKWSRLSGVNISKVEDLFEKDYSYDQLVALKTANNGEFWASLSQEARDYLDNLIECKKSTEEFQETALEKLTGIKFDDMYSNFMSTLEDMNKGADDFTNDIKNKIRKAIIDNALGKEVDAFVKDWMKRYQEMTEADGGKLTEEHANELMQELEEKSNEIFNRRNEILNKVGLGAGASSGSQKQGYATASEDSIAELSGRALAQTEALYQIRDNQLLNTSTINSIDNNLMQVIVIENKRNTYYEESLDIYRTTVGHLAAIEQNTHELYSMNDKLTKIEKNTRNI